MLQFFVSKSLAEEMASHLVPNTHRNPEAMCWYAHQVPVLGGSCTMVMEAYSRYCLVFHNLTKADFAQFPLLFRDRLRREVLALCQISESNGPRLADLVKQACTDYHFGLGLDYAVSADIYDAARHLQTIIEDLGGYPIVGVTEFALGIKLNQQPLPSLSGTATTSALDAFREQWLQKLSHLSPAASTAGVSQHWPHKESPPATTAKSPTKK